MNKILAEFLISLVRDPDRLRRFNTEEGRRNLLAASNLTDDDKMALMSDDPATLLDQLQVGEDEDVGVVLGPGIKAGFTIGGGIKGPEPDTSARQSARTRKSGKAGKSKTNRKAGGKGRPARKATAGARTRATKRGSRGRR